MLNLFRLTENNRTGFFILILLMPLSLMWLAYNNANDLTILSRAFWFVIFAVFSAFLYVQMCQYNLNTAMSYIVVVMVLQAVFVYISILSPDFRIWVGQALVSGGNVDFSNAVRFSGLSNGGAANLSLQLGLGVAAAAVIYTQTRSEFTKYLLLVSALFITFSTVFVGRTGLYLSLLMLTSLLLTFAKSPIKLAILALSLWGVVLFVNSASSNYFASGDNPVKLDRTVNWAFDVFMYGDSDSVNALMDLSSVREPTITNLLIGSGRVSEYDGSNYAGHDSGYLHLIYAVGLPFSILFYISLLMIYIRIIKPVRGGLKLYGLIFIALIFFLEIKEPFIFKYSLPFFVFVYSYLARARFLEGHLNGRT
jgi:hypothetical protein